MILKTLPLFGLSMLAMASPAAARECAQSPGKILELCVSVENGEARYQVTRGDVTVIAPSRLGLRFAGEAEPRFAAIADAERSAVDTTWEQPWGEQRLIRDNHNQLSVTLAGDTPLNRAVGVTFRLFDDGFGFRYDYRAIPAGQSVSVVADHSQFRTVGAYQAWWYEGLGQERDEYLYKQTDARRVTLAETPLTLKGDNGLYLSFHEAALVDFPSMLLRGDGAGTYNAWLMPWPDGILAKKTGPFTTPWRTVLVGETPGALADSRITLNLNEPSKVPGIGQWFKPGKYVGIWWEMHLEKSTWGSGPKHGANTANVKRHIDFAAKYGFEGVLVEGWNEGWDGDWIANGDKFSFTRAYPDFDLAEIMRYGKAKGVKLIGQSTLATQLAEYVVIYSPIQMAADLPENYEARPDAFRFSRDVPADWEQSRTLQGAIGDEETRELRQPLAFLAPGARYEAQIYADGPAADYRSNPGALTIEKRMVTSGDTLTLRLAPGGGTAIRFRRVD